MSFENVKMPKRCKVCGEDPTERGSGGMYKDKDKKLAKEYCENTANTNQIVKPIWKECCGALDYYSVTLKDNKKPLWKRNLEKFK